MNKFFKVIAACLLIMGFSLSASFSSHLSSIKNHGILSSQIYDSITQCAFLRYGVGSILLLAAYKLACETGLDVCYKWLEVKEKAYEIEKELRHQDTNNFLTNSELKRLSLLQAMGKSFKLFWREVLALAGVSYLTYEGIKLLYSPRRVYFGYLRS